MTAHMHGFNRLGALPAIDKLKSDLYEGKQISILESAHIFGANPEGFSRDGARQTGTTEYRDYIVKKLYQNYVLLESVSGSYRRGIIYFDLAKYGKEVYLWRVG